MKEIHKMELTMFFSKLKFSYLLLKTISNKYLFSKEFYMQSFYQLIKPKNYGLSLIKFLRMSNCTGAKELITHND